MFAKANIPTADLSHDWRILENNKSKGLNTKKWHCMYGSNERNA
jgi:hypothetical protein